MKITPRRDGSLRGFVLRAGVGGGFAAGAATRFANKQKGFRPSGATSFAPVGKGGKTPFKGEMFRLISPLKIPLSATKKRVATPFFDFSPGMGGDL